jgi:hypothetical protein
MPDRTIRHSEAEPMHQHWQHPKSSTAGGHFGGTRMVEPPIGVPPYAGLVRRHELAGLCVNNTTRSTLKEVPGTIVDIIPAAHRSSWHTIN